MALDTVQDYIGDVRTLLQDIISPYRYDDPSLLVALNITLLEMRRLRADLFVYNRHDRFPSYTAVNSEQIHLEHAFRLPLVYGIVAHALARDQEDVQDQRATVFMNIFNNLLLGTRHAPFAAPKPQPQKGDQ